MAAPRTPRSTALPRLLYLLFFHCELLPAMAFARAPEPRPETLPWGQPSLDIVHPIRVDAGGSFLSYDLSPRLLRRRDLSSKAGSPTYYELLYHGRELRFNLSINLQLLAPGFVSETRYGGITHAKIRPYTHSYACHLVGEVQDSELEGGFAAISSCNGLKGVFQLSREDYFIEPLDGSEPRAEAAQPHVVYKRQAPEHQEDWRTGAKAHTGTPLPRVLGTCGIKESPENHGKSEKRRERWEQKQQQQQRRRRLQQRSISKEKWVETLVVADTKMVEYHGWEHVENYVLTVMNMVAGLFHDPSIGNPIHISIVRLILLGKEEEDLKITHHADNTLKSFCKWQKSINMKGDTHPLHHDVAVLLTRRDLCASMNRPCETLGLSHVSGMCQPHRSCNINEDTGLPLAFTVAHELGHSFGIQHDGSGNDCEPVGKKTFIMSPQLLYDSPLTWSRCSQEYITRFLDRGWGLCLDDPPANDVIDFPIVPPGVLYDVSHQCRLQYGAYSTFCDDMDNVCNTLWCSVGTTCHSKLDAAVDGTRCGENKWCFNGECVSVGFRPDAVDGAWAGWSSWSSCSRSCGVGVQSSERRCSNPTPKYGGKYCVGERKRFRLCSIQACPADRPSFRHIQCSQFDAMPYKGEQYKWVPVSNHINPCELHCRPANEYFAIKLRDAVVDGTPCFEGNTSRDLCINGICKNVGCDYEIDSNAIEDRCGVCHGDGSTCETVKKTFDETEGLGYVDIGLIPAGAREIRIEEVAEAANFLALRSEDPEKYFLNGGWTIQWNGDYKVAGTTFTYERNGNWENLTSPGPTWEPIWIQLLFQESNPGVRYQYTIRREADNENEIQPPEFSWRYGAWTKCTVTCGTGVQRQAVHCVEKLAGLVEERHCDALTRPDDRQKNCSQEPCPARWWFGEWRSCSRTCGPGGLALRTVLCIQSVGLDEQRALRPEDCHPMPKPEATQSCNEDIPCPASWGVGNWSECSVSCGMGIHSRTVFCTNETGTPCDPTQKPISETACSLPPCPWMPENPVPEWSGSGSSSRELFNEIEFIPSNHIPPFGHPAPGAPGPQDSNVITEDDFSPNDKKGNVFVDDFYYDYNFINFHEDLSNSPFEDRDKPSEEIGGDTSDETPLAAPPSSEGEDQGDPESHTTQPGPAQEEVMRTDGQRSVGFTAEPLPSIHTPTLIPFSPSPGQKEGTGPPEDLPAPQPSSTNSDHNFFLDKFPEGPMTGTVSKEDPAFPASYPLSPSLPPSPTVMLVDSDKATTTTSKGEAQGDATSPQGPGVLRSKDDNGNHVPTGASEKDPDGLLWEGLDVASDDDRKKFPGGIAASGTTPASPPLPHELNLSLPSPQITSLQPFLSASPSNPPKTEVPIIPKDAHPTERSWSSSDPRLRDNEPLSPEGTWRATSSPMPSDTKPPETSLPRVPELGSPELPARDLIQWDLQIPVGPVTSDPNDLAGPGVIPWNDHFLSSALTPSPGLENLSNEIRVSHNPDFLSPPSRPWAPQPADANKWLGSPGGETSPSNILYDGGDLKNKFQSPTNTEPVGTKEPPQGTLATAEAPGGASWEVGDWNECSTTCGLGAIWRPVHCSTGREEDCVATSKPVPARRCYLRPCSTWRVGNWSKCSRNCGGGFRFRDVHCVDTRDRRLLRPFHCQPGLFKPLGQLSCHVDPCLDWYTSSWRECSESCGGGEQERLVTCPEFGRCEETMRPNTTRPCNTHPCTKWVVGPWGQCSATCGGGIQRRLVKCVNTKTSQPEEDNSLCDHEAWPENFQRCNPEDCPASDPDLDCDRDRLTFSFCETLHFLGRCHLPTVRAQCCKTCLQDSHGSRDRGNERASRR
ncbi:A disintegrin and metalloproteinase with thrombospondin motifs 7 [Dromiciops gliroides]|uniref:A disintegrin and metalloproteinase with thrombospondin motifs 7 n=1 Tax=Dromiciops gliroides TaxID=33562 RepID=UPI001CC75944|nr:A disintegrin and metalloproteinase with thrombospondin motifs 7 [Dromiciops gliroides]